MDGSGSLKHGVWGPQKLLGIFYLFVGSNSTHLESSS